ncbi:MAG: OmpA family protein [Thermoanaerobaculia bacterium]|nr:OmpA family protein [Thermoanaerobaculia bacterium]
MRNKTVIIVAIVSIVAASCISSDDPNKRTKQGAAVGAAAGAVVGTIVGHQNDEKGEGAVIGAAAGAGIGALIGRRMDKQQQELEKLEGVEVTRTAEDQIDLAIKNEILFDVDSATLRPRAKTTLEEIAEVFREYPDTNLRVEGHADSTGSDAHNQRLSDRRAESVSNYLVMQGVSGARIDAIGFGESEPRASNATAEGRQLNRRVEIRIKAQG